MSVSQALDKINRKRLPERKDDSVSRLELLAGEKKPDESVRAVLACNEFLRMGPARNVAALCRRFKRLAQLESGADAVPTVSNTTLYSWSWDFEWFKRAELYDARVDKDKTDLARESMNTGLAMPHLRVDKLKMLAAKLEQEIYREGRLWLPDVKQIGMGKNATRVELIRFNGALVEQYRGVLSDLAEETGGRWKINRNFNYDLDKLSDEQLQALAEGKDVLPIGSMEERSES